MLDKVFTHRTKSLQSEPLIQAASDLRTGDLNLKCVLEIETGIIAVANVISGADTAEVSILYKNSEFQKKALAG